MLYNNQCCGSGSGGASQNPCLFLETQIRKINIFWIPDFKRKRNTGKRG